MPKDEILKNQLNKKRQLELENEKKDEEREIDRTKDMLDEALDNLEFKKKNSKPQGKIAKLKHWWLQKSLKQNLLILSAFALSLLLLFVFFIYIWWTGKDAILFKSTLEGKVYDRYEKNIEDVSISIDGKYKTKTNSKGEFEIKGLDNGKVKVLLEKKRI